VDTNVKPNLRHGGGVWLVWSKTLIVDAPIDEGPYRLFSRHAGFLKQGGVIWGEEKRELK
jgi:hypothetical protein